MQVDAGKLKAYYMDAYAAVRKSAPDCFFVVSPRNWEQDGGAWQNFMAGPEFTKVLQDVHRCEFKYISMCRCLDYGSGKGLALWPQSVRSHGLSCRHVHIHVCISRVLIEARLRVVCAVRPRMRHLCNDSSAGWLPAGISWTGLGRSSGRCPSRST